MEFHRRQGRQVENPDAATLEYQRIIRPPPAEEPAGNQQSGTRQRDAGVTEFDRHRDPLGGVAQEERQANEKNEHTELDQRIAAENQFANGRRQPVAERDRRLGRGSSG